MHKNEPTLVVNARVLRRGSTDAEHWLWQRLRARRLLGFKFRRQAPIGPYIADVVCKERRLIIELDGSQHQEQRSYDQRRTTFLNSQGYEVLRYWNNEVLQQGEAVLASIAQALQQPQRR